jgi:hypothetical protein
MKRRAFLEGALTLPAVVAASEWFAVARVLSGKPFKVTAVVYDERYTDCRAFAKALVGQGAMSFATLGDAGRVWYGALRGYLARTGGSVAGMATHSDWVISRACGREQGLRVAYEGSHDSRMPGRMNHRLGGSGREREVYRALLDPDLTWPEAVATGLLRSYARCEGRTGGAVEIAKAGAVPGAGQQPSYLTSWLLNPSALWD